MDNMTIEEQFLHNKEIKDNVALCITDMINVINAHNNEDNKIECFDLFKEIQDILESYDVHMDDFTDTIEQVQYSETRMKMAKLLSEHKYDGGLYSVKPSSKLYYKSQKWNM